MPKAGQLGWPGLTMVLRVQTRRRQRSAGDEQVSYQGRYFISSFVESAARVGQSIRQYWGVVHRVHYVRGVTQGEAQRRCSQSWSLLRSLFE